MNGEKEFVEITLSQGKVAIIDLEDYKRVSKYKWFTFKRVYKSKTVYSAVASPKRNKFIWLNQFILKSKKVKCIHINGNSLDYRKYNLIVMDNFGKAIKVGLAHRGKYSTNKSGYKGVCWHQQKGRNVGYWKASITNNQKQKHLGLFDTSVEAAKAYDIATLEINGPTAFTNFPKENYFK